MPDAIETVKKIFDGLEENEIQAMMTVAEKRTHPTGTVLVREGRLEHTFYVIVDGMVAITRQLQDGGSRHLNSRGPGEFFGEMALIDNAPRAATVVTTMETTVLEISEHDFNQLLRRNPAVATSMLRSITATLRANDQAAIADLSRKNIELVKAYADLKAAQAEIVAKEKLERELEIAAELQRSLLPDVFPTVEGWTFAGNNIPARTIGGDLYDVIRIDDDHVGLLMADVSDKSIHAALFMAVTRSLFLPESRRSLSPRTVALEVHRNLLEVSSADSMFVTAFYGVLTPKTGHLRYVRAGQDRPIWLHKGQAGYTELDAQGRFLGMLDVLDLEECEVTLGRGDTLVMYSDGVPDAVNLKDEPYTLERLSKLLETHRNEPAGKICNTIFDDVFNFRDNAPAFDDITVLVARADD